MGSTRIWKSSTRLADGREIIYYDEIPDSGRADFAGTRDLPPAVSAPQPELVMDWRVHVGRDARTTFALRLDVMSPQRAAGRLKYVASTEAGTGVWSNDVLPENAARTIREAM